ncbi:DUF2147 domain-containing protein [Asticcacaulis sp. AC402]|uniref:DUF2147 domain-containing protein n=1 Tax=Asticcacaulis sp. AC402 TaxID=1282361 RepID=UPI0003C3AF69|nr:DUF2147 domain-containing protein [Asticcacaulis sp. AC402]ESQ73761.1 hypothetical protein ABAC402_17620 [Asticcacaulis sp. AC402]
MKHSILTVVACIGLFVAPAVAQASPQGDWARGDGNATVTIAPCGPDLCAVNTWIKPGLKDEKVGDVLVMSVKAEGDIWKGKAFDPQRNLNYRLTIRVKDAGMTTSGCILGGLVCKTVSWTRL